MVSPEIRLLLRILDDAYDKPAWHGPNLRNSLRKVSSEEVVWRPPNGQRNLWEITLHAAYWKYVVWRRLRGEKRGSFPRKGSDWFPRPAEETSARAIARGWREDVALLDEMHQKLREAVAALTSEELETHQSVLYGAALHDVYHAGQIQSLRQMVRAARKP